jgi:hypothetical protein
LANFIQPRPLPLGKDEKMIRMRETTTEENHPKVTIGRSTLASALLAGARQHAWSDTHFKVDKEPAARVMYRIFASTFTMTKRRTG